MDFNKISNDADTRAIEYFMNFISQNHLKLHGDNDFIKYIVKNKFNKLQEIVYYFCNFIYNKKQLEWIYNEHKPMLFIRDLEFTIIYNSGYGVYAERYEFNLDEVNLKLVKEEDLYYV